MHFSRTRRVVIAVAIALGCAALWWASIRPSNSREWTPDQAVLPAVSFSGSIVTVQNVRNNTYRSTTDYDVRWETRTYDIRKVKTAWYIVEPFSEWEGSAHTFVSFGFDDGEYVAISPEIRKEKGEKFSAWKGLWKNYELMYVVGDERDLVKLRSNYRKDQVFVYPVRATTEQAQALFASMLRRAGGFAERPEFYHSLFNACATNIAHHANEIAPGKISLWDYRVLAPGYSDRLAHEIGLLDTDLPFAQARVRFKINDRAERFAESEDFSERIRAE